MAWRNDGRNEKIDNKKNSKLYQHIRVARKELQQIMQIRKKWEDYIRETVRTDEDIDVGGRKRETGTIRGRLLEGDNIFEARKGDRTK